MNRKTVGVMALITIAVACLPLFTINCIGGHDILYHLLRIDALKAGIQNGLPFLRVNLLFFGGMGYASSMFYPDFLLYLPAVLRALGAGINLSFHIFAAFCIIAGFTSAYFSMKTVTRGRLAPLCCAMIFTLYQYFLDDIFTRSAVGEYTAMLFLPLVLAGLYDLIFLEFKKPYLLGLGMAGIILCHTLTTLLALVLCLAAVLICCRRLLKSPGKLLKLCLTALCVLCATSFYWLPMLEQMASSSFQYANSIFDLQYERMLLKDVFQNRHPGMGLAIFLLLAPRLFLKKRSDRIRFADLCLLAAFLFILCTTGLFPWGRLQDELSFIQFPWRLFAVTGPLLAFAEAIYLDAFQELLPSAPWSKEASCLLCATAVLIVMTVSAIQTQGRNDQEYYSYSDDYFDYAPYTGNVIGGEWLPMGATDRDSLTTDAPFALLPDGKKVEVLRDRNSLSLTGLDPSLSYVDVPFLYYKGYRASSLAGKPLKLDGSGENGRVRVYPDGAEGIRVSYGGTVLQKASTWISLLTLLGVLGLGFYKKRKGAPKE